MAITTILGTDTLKNSRVPINNNFAALSLADSTTLSTAVVYDSTVLSSANSAATVGDSTTLSTAVVYDSTVLSSAQSYASSVATIGAGTIGATQLATNVKANAIVVALGDSSNVIAADEKADFQVPFTCTINGVRLLADQTGSIVVDIWKDTYANYPPTSGDKITASAPPTIAGATKSEDLTLTGWTSTITAGDCLRFNVTSCAAITRVTVVLLVTPT